MIRFKSARDITLGFRFQKVERGPGELPTVTFDIVAACPLFAFDDNGKYIDHERFMFMDQNSNHVDEIEDACFLAAGSIFPSLHPEINKREVDFLISFYSDTLMFAKEFKSFSEIINSDFFEQIYNEISES